MFIYPPGKFWVKFPFGLQGTPIGQVIGHALGYHLFGSVGGSHNKDAGSQDAACFTFVLLRQGPADLSKHGQFSLRRALHQSFYHARIDQHNLITNLSARFEYCIIARERFCSIRIFGCLVYPPFFLAMFLPLIILFPAFSAIN